MLGSKLPGLGPAEGEMLVAEVIGTFGVHGELKVFLHNKESSLWRKPCELVAIVPAGTRHAVTLKVRTGAGKRVLGSIEGVSGRDAADALRGLKLYVDEGRLPALKPDEFYVSQLEGAVVWQGGKQIGTVSQVHQTPTMDVFEVKLGGGAVAWVTAQAANIEELDPAAGRLVLAESAELEEM